MPGAQYDQRTSNFPAGSVTPCANPTAFTGRLTVLPSALFVASTCQPLANASLLTTTTRRSLST